METSREARNDAYLDALVQMGVLRVTEREGEEWISFRRSPWGVIERSMQLGLLAGSDDQEFPTIEIAAAMSVTLLHDSGAPFSETDLVGIASVLNGVLLSSLEGTLPLKAPASQIVHR